MLKKHNSIVCLVLTLLTQSSQAQSSLPPRTVLVQKGIVLKFAIVAELNSGTARKGDAVPLRLTRPLVVDGITLLPVGAQAQGRVSEVKRAGPKCVSGFIELDVPQVRFPDSSIALTEVAFRTPRSGAPIPEKINDSQIRRGRHDLLKAIPFIILLTPLYLLAAISVGAGENGGTGGGLPPCAYGREFIFPVGSTVGVVVGKKHRVQY